VQLVAISKVFSFAASGYGSDTARARARGQRTACTAGTTRACPIRMKENLVAETQMTIHGSPSDVWNALTKPELVKKYMMGADVKSDWKVGSALTYTGEYKGKPFEEKGVIQKIERDKLLQATHFSTTSGKEDKPENYAVVTWQLHGKDGATVVAVSQDGIASQQGVETSKANWAAVLKGLKQTVES
jgi:uncharacterized protein YndB with AHSA1/START domain